ncbi:fluoride efflux transporter FluC [Microbacterium xanthum]|uniref:fluoride efflux transporter FluC n=1 Tax=Microbacterium xanthum TaxID=3079794 RepID=UPI002AD37183|nr:CrcB family protein [Microbacterium sp. KSW-48]MDZ8171437.1 CrcB family protein [Microbacterium sp. KSW-48]
MTRTPLVRPRILGLVVAGGVVGVALRELVLLPFASGASVTLATLAVNVVGSFLLGVVVAALGDRHPLWRSFAGTGALGGFTTYSAFAVQAAVAASTAPWVGVLLAVAAVLGGLAAAAGGIALAHRLRDAAGRSR